MIANGSGFAGKRKAAFSGGPFSLFFYSVTESTNAFSLRERDG
jgi:hypothetical protein